MAIKRFVAYYTHESELAKVSSETLQADTTDSFVVGEMDEDGIARLAAEGILIQVLAEEAKEAPVGSPAPAPAPASAPRPSHRSLRSLPGAPLPQGVNAHGKSPFVIELAGPYLLESWKDQLRVVGIELQEALEEGGYAAHLRIAQVNKLRNLNFVKNVRLARADEFPSGMFNGDRTADRDALVVGGIFDGVGLIGQGDGSQTAGVPAPMPLPVPSIDLTRFDVLLHDPARMPELRAWLAGEGIRVLEAGTRKVRIELDRNSAQLRRIESQPSVKQLHEHIPPTLKNDSCRRVMGFNASVPVAAHWRYLGAGEVVAVADSGIDQNHPDFSGRIKGVVPRGRPGNASDPQGHGTHVAGTVLGSGAGSGGSDGQFCGVAPKAELFFQSIMDAAGNLGGLPLELGGLFEEAYQAGARIHNNSWSSDTKSFYTIEAMEVDEFVASKQDMLIVIAAGNCATTVDPFGAASDSVNPLSMGSPATAKNALTVGASSSDRTDGPNAHRLYTNLDPVRFQNLRIGVGPVSGNAESLAAFSGRGPSDPRRIKPDLVAPGTDVLSAKAQTAPVTNFWGPYQANSQYAYLGGTSMAAPAVAGCAAIVREFYREEHNHQASAALLKATLINGTRRLKEPDANVGHDLLPNFHQGFGVVYMPYTHPNDKEPWMHLLFNDTYLSTNDAFVQTGQRHRYLFEVEAGDFLRICLVWTDPAAGSSLQNNLGLILETPGVPPVKIMGNHDRQNPIGLLDRDNNVQIIRVERPQPGNYMLQVFAPSILKTGQHYAVVVTGAIPGGMHRMG